MNSSPEIQLQISTKDQIFDPLDVSPGTRPATSFTSSGKRRKRPTRPCSGKHSSWTGGGELPFHQINARNRLPFKIPRTSALETTRLKMMANPFWSFGELTGANLFAPSILRIPSPTWPQMGHSSGQARKLSNCLKQNLDAQKLRLLGPSPKLGQQIALKLRLDTELHGGARRPKPPGPHVGVDGGERMWCHGRLLSGFTPARSPMGFGEMVSFFKVGPLAMAGVLLVSLPNQRKAPAKRDTLKTITYRGVLELEFAGPKCML